MQQQKLGVVDLHPLKRVAEMILPTDSILRAVLLSEPDSLKARDYLAKLGTWLALLRQEEEVRA
ncbi:MAG: hypothetical protein JRN58_03130 [Nitrososphaerota archaeon]|nr:hypothetical protein [Nitrososphaerota archaeon]